ncbi:hypothetical protein ADK86_06575 [Streptomyces sp. NRRL F-5755]|uniref:hypothetical protein n=1 Tax=Streptomyces sp. NRRL F-5755 TaxID=1519475 RepID=UPI0006BFFCFE|nr:hypothetical protein [Streptomyces sp. NRRL F-5755]KOU05930.1 hypothetical protein ADK86_06575 [Streptomyces sp. NRRL F-5755]
MGRRRARARGAGGFAVLLCALLALPCAGWIARDVWVAERAADIWWLWAGEPVRPQESPVWATTLLDPLLGLGYLCTAAAVLRRSPSANCALTAMAAATLLFRLPLLRTLGADRLSGPEPGVRQWALVTAGVALLLSVLLLITASAGRDRTGRPPGRLRLGPAALAALLLGAAGLALAAWQAYWIWEMGWPLYRDSVIGSTGVFRALLQPPPNWYLLSLVLPALVSAVGVAQRTVSMRPLGMLTAALLLTHGAARLTAEQRAGLLGRFSDLPTSRQLDVVTWTFVAVAGLVALFALTRPADSARPRGSEAGQMPPGFTPPAPPSKLPPNW